MKTSDLIEQRAAIVTRMTEAHASDNGEAFTAAETELRGLDTKLDRQRTIDALDRAEPGHVITGDGKLETELRSRFSIVRAMAMQAGIGGHDFGFEREVQPDLVKRAGRVAEGVLVPTEIFLEKRVLTTAAPSGGPGGNLIATELHGEMYFDRLRAALKVGSLGATVLNGLVGNIDIPGLKTSMTAGWVAENTALSSSDAEFRKVSMTPKHAGGITEMSRNMLQQTSRDIEQLVRNDFAQVLAGIVDIAAIAGTGSSNQPRGILSTSGIGTVAMGTNGLAFTPNAARDLIGRVDIADGPMTSRAFLTNTKVKVATSKIVDGQGNYMGYGPEGVFAGERVEFSNNVPSNLTKGSGTNLSAVLYGDWSQLLIGYWSAFDLLVNPYESTAYAKGNVSVRAMLTCDTAVRYAEAFAACTDAVA